MASTMATLKILFITCVYPPQRFPRSVQISHLVKYLSNDCDIDVITAVAKANIDNSLLKFTPLHNIHVANKSWFTQFLQSCRGHKLKQAVLPDLHYAEHFDLLSEAKRRLKKFHFDLIVTFGQPMSTHLIGLKLKLAKPCVKWFAHFSDPWIDNPYNEYNPWTLFINSVYQDRVFNKADKLIFTSTETIELVMRRYDAGIKKKAVCLPHAYNEALYTNERKDSNKFIIRYLGNFYGSRQPTALFAGLRRVLHKLSDIRIELIGAKTNNLDQKIDEYELSEVVYSFPPVDYLDSLRLASSSDLLLVIDAPNHRSPFLPSKLIDYIGANRPIFAITPPGATRDLVDEMNFLSANPQCPEQIATKLLEMITAVKQGSMSRIEPNIRDRYSIHTVGLQFLKIISHVGHKT